MDAHPSGSRAGLAVGAALLVVLAVLTAALAGEADTSPRAAEAPELTTTSPGTPATAPAPTAPALPRDYPALERAALVVIDKEDVVLIDLDGTELIRGPRAGWHPGYRDRGVDIDGGGTIGDAPALDDPVPGCDAVHGRGGVKVAVCGSGQTYDEIRLLTDDNRSRVLSGPINAVGRWQYALPSPDGRWVLGQWSGECEIPTAYLFRVTGGPGRAVFGTEFDSSAIGWAPDGRAIVSLRPGACGASSDEAGTYVVDPGSARRQRIHPSHEAVLLTAVRGFFTNRMEQVMGRALDELGLEQCCAQPSHGGAGAETGFVFEGHRIFVYAVPHDALNLDRQPEPDELRFECGRARYHLRDGGPPGSASGDGDDDDEPDPPLLRRAAARLAPRLYCTPGAVGGGRLG